MINQIMSDYDILQWTKWKQINSRTIASDNKRFVSLMEVAVGRDNHYKWVSLHFSGEQYNAYLMVNSTEVKIGFYHRLIQRDFVKQYELEIEDVSQIEGIG